MYKLDSTYHKKQLKIYQNSDSFYSFEISKNEVIDPREEGNLARFINHSDTPNCIATRWTVNERDCIGIFAISDIKKDQEITFDYRMG